MIVPLKRIKWLPFNGDAQGLLMGTEGLTLYSPVVTVYTTKCKMYTTKCKIEELYEGWNFNSGNYLFTTDTK